MELPFHLRALPPEALDVLRFYHAQNLSIAKADEIMDGVGLSERAFGKVIRRLVTKNYLQMDGEQNYRLTDHGQEAVETMADYDSDAPAAKTETKTGSAVTVARRLVLVTPRPFVAGSAADVHIGFLAASDGQILDGTADVVLRISVVNGTPTRPQEVGFQLDDQTAHQTFKITPGNYKKLRIRVQAFQLGPNPDDINVAGGMYVDSDVTASGASNGAAAFGANVTLSEPE